MGSITFADASRSTSDYQEIALPRWIRDPSSTSSFWWDMVQLAFLIYVSFSVRLPRPCQLRVAIGSSLTKRACVPAAQVPYRVCFEIDVPFGSSWSVFEGIVDAYFIADLVLNFRTAFMRAVTQSPTTVTAPAASAILQLSAASFCMLSGLSSVGS